MVIERTSALGRNATVVTIGRHRSHAADVQPLTEKARLFRCGNPLQSVASHVAGQTAAGPAKVSRETASAA